MGQAIPVRTDYTAGEVRRLAQRAKDAAQARRLLAIAAVLDGASREEAAADRWHGSSDAAELGDPRRQQPVRSICRTRSLPQRSRGVLRAELKFSESRQGPRQAAHPASFGGTCFEVRGLGLSGA
jgi:hypothetical protein